MAARAGRKRRDGERYPGGRLKPQPATPAGMGTTGQANSGRAWRERDVVEDGQVIGRAWRCADPLDALAPLVEAGHLSCQQLAALRAFAGLHARAWDIRVRGVMAGPQGGDGCAATERRIRAQRRMEAWLARVPMPMQVLACPVALGWATVARQAADSGERSVWNALRVLADAEGA